MTAHELARALLEMPDTTVGFLEYTGGDDEYMEVEQAELVEFYPGIILRTYPKQVPS